ncbi:MAG TPA: CDP-alcohol phosphatidyltransferase family protein [Polyangiaceae bacterium]|nr:CDP-alcohol phosphatidyltransferase family protein [Polyangiaceae bacterium]
MSPAAILPASASLDLLERWSRVHAFAMLAATGIALVAREAWPIALVGLSSVAALVITGARSGARVGTAANGVTALRLLFVTSLGLAALAPPSGLLVALAVLGIFVLDGVDGALARRFGAESAFGARLDLETDALLVLVVDFLLHAVWGYGVWVLVSGLLRYVYTLTLAVFPPPGGPAPRSRFARSSFGLFVTSRIAALALPAAVAVPVAGLGSLLLWFSFARSFFYAYARPGVAPGEGAPIVDEALARDDAAPSDPRA